MNKAGIDEFFPFFKTIQNDEKSLNSSKNIWNFIKQIFRNFVGKHKIIIIKITLTLKSQLNTKLFSI